MRAQAHNYKHLAEKAKNYLFNDPKITQRNKDIVEDFLLDYHQSDGRKQIVMTNLRIILQKSKDISKDMHDQKTMDAIYRAIYQEKQGYFETIRNVSKMFCRRINDDELPKAVKKALRKFKKEDNQRELIAKDLILWEDGLKMIAATNSIQFKAIIALQIDAGLRPSEFANLNFGDIERKNDFVVVRVREGKTGSREVVCWRCVPYVLKWLAEHKTKKSADPLWLQECNTQGKLLKYNYSAILKQVKAIAKAVGIKKSVDFYALRHSSCFLDKLDNIPLDIASERHGHSVKFFTRVYGKLDTDAIIKRLKKHNGVEEEEKKADKNITCSKCKFVNTPKSDFCEQCNSPLNMRVALEQQTDVKQELEDFKKDVFLHLKKEALQELKAELGIK